MNKTIVILSIVVVVILAVGGYFIFSNNNSNGNSTYTSPVVNTSGSPTATASSEAQPTSTPTPSATPAPTTTPKPTSVTVSIKNFAFTPATITIKKGTKVTWTNNDTAPHTVTSDSGSVLDSATLSPGQSYSVTFTEVGSISYHCSIHPMMHGTIVVTN